MGDAAVDVGIAMLERPECVRVTGVVGLFVWDC